MRTFEFITEKRSNPDLNPTILPADQLKTYHDNAQQLSSRVKNLFISLTSIDKIGINPNSTYNTPLGIYAYSVDYALKTINTSFRDLPFVGNAPYINVFTASNPNKIIVLNSMTEDEYVKQVNQLKSMKEYAKYVIADENIDITRVPGGKFWLVTRLIAEDVGKKTSQKSSIVWNSIFRKLGIDGCIDTGAGIIHPNEPAQAVFFSIKSIDVLSRIKNKDVIGDIPSKELVPQIVEDFFKVSNKTEYNDVKEKYRKYLTSKEGKRYIPISVMVRFNLEDAIEYAQIRKTRLKSAEQRIAQDSRLSLLYAMNVVGKFPEGEQAIATDEFDAMRYTKAVLKNKRFPAGEETILNSVFADEYAIDIVKEPWDKYEDKIYQTPAKSVKYARTVLKGERFPAAEPYIAKDPASAYEYASNIIDGPWPMAELTLASHSVYAFYYATRILKSRFPAGEEAISHDNSLNDQYQRFLKTLPPPLKSDTPTPLKYWLGIDNKAAGPYPKDEILNMMNSGQINRDTPIWGDGFANWVPLISVIFNIQ